MNIDINKFSIKNNNGSSDEESNNNNRGMELQYKIADGIAFTIPAEKMAQAAMGAFMNVAEKKFNEGVREIVGDPNDDYNHRG